MRRIEEQMKRLAALAGVMAMAAAEALAQDKAGRPARRILVSIPDRKLAVLEDDRVVKIFQTAVGAPKSPSPAGSFTIVTQIPEPTWYTKGRVVPPGKSESVGHALDGLEQEGLRNSRHERSRVDRAERVARLHPDAQSGRGGAVHDGRGGRRGGAGGASGRPRRSASSER